MRKRNKSFLMLCAVVILISLIFLSINNCKKELRLIPIGEARIVQKLENGNYEVTQAFIYEYWRMKKEIDKLKEK